MDSDTITTTLRDILISSKSIFLKSSKAITVGFQLILKGVNVPGGMIVENYNSLLSKINELGGGTSPVVTELENRVSTLETTLKETKNITISDKYKSFDGTASDRVAASSYALYMLYKLLEKRFDIKNEVNIALESQEGDLSVITKSGWCRICGYIKTTQVTGTPMIVLRGLPIPYGREANLKVMGLTSFINVNINKNGIMTVKGGESSTKFYLEIAYPYIEEE